MPDDYLATTQTTGRVSVGGSATGEIETANDFDWFAVELVAGESYVIDLEGADSGGGTLDSTVLRGVYDARGQQRIAGTQTNDGGVGDDARLLFTAAETGTHYIAARGHGQATGTYTVRVAALAGDEAPVFAQASYTMELEENADGALFGIALAPVVATGPDNGAITYSIVAGDVDRFVIDAETGVVVYVGTGEDPDSGATSYELTVRASDGALHSDVTVTVNVGDVEDYAILEQTVNESPQFTYASYAFELDENAAGDSDPVSLGVVQATDPEAGTLIYSIESGDPDGLFEGPVVGRHLRRERQPHSGHEERRRR